MNDVKITWHSHTVSREDRERLNGHAGCVIWFTGLSGCGKSTIANALDKLLLDRGAHAVLLDGDNVRHRLTAAANVLVQDHSVEFAQRFGLGFSAMDREENIRRVGAVAQLFCSAGIITLAAFVSPYRRDRDLAHALVETAGQPGDFVEVFVDTPLEICEARDPKGLYKKARAGELKGLTGIDDPYEAPEYPELTLESHRATPAELAQQVIDYLVQHGQLR